MMPAAARPGDALSRRQFGAGALALVAALASGCASTISPEEEQSLGRREAESIARTTGLVQDPALVGYVRQVGGRLAQVTGRSITWQFNVADDPEPNAFALPGGYVYVTRGLLVLLNAEDELAGVLGHEMGHVLERHAVRRASAATPFAAIFGVPAGILGTVSPTLGGLVGGTGRLASDLALAPYNRDQEREADQLGMALAARAGWNPAGLGSFLRTLARGEALSGQASRGPRFLATHPATPERVAAVEASVATHPRAAAAPLAGTRAAFVARLENVVVGDDPAHGVFMGQTFIHPGIDLALDVPERWTTVNTPEAAGAVAPDGDAAVLLQMVAEGSDPVAGARAEGLAERDLARIERRRVGGLDTARLVAETRDGDRVIATWIAHRGRVLRVTGITAARDWDRYAAALERTAGTVRPLSAADRDRLVESRLRIRGARAGETIAQVLARGGGKWDATQTAVANGVEPTAKLEAGWPVKIPVAQRYRPTS